MTINLLQGCPLLSNTRFLDEMVGAVARPESNQVDQCFINVLVSRNNSKESSLRPLFYPPGNLVVTWRKKCRQNSRLIF